MTAADRPPIDLPRSPASVAAAHELSRGIYGHVSWSRELGRAAGDALRRLLSAAPGHSGPIGVLVLIAALLVVAAVGLGLVRIGAPGRNARQAARPAPTPAAPTAVDLRTRAAMAAQVGDWTTAVLAGFRAVARELVEAGAVPAAMGAPGLTAAELVEVAVPALPAAAAELRAAAAVFGSISYGYFPAGPVAFATVTAADRAVGAALSAPGMTVRS